MPKLKPYQRVGVRRIQRFGGRALLADSMGLGKTAQVVRWVRKYAPQNRPVVVVCPANLKWNWTNEIKMWGFGKLRFQILSTRTPHRPPTFRQRNSKTIYVINYDVLPWWEEWLRKLQPSTLICDECFPYDTLVETDKGLLKIGDIVEQKLKVRVASFNFSRNAIAFNSIKHYVKIKRHTRLVTVFHSEGRLVCTEEHEIWTVNRGYVKAKSLRQGDRLRVLQKEKKNRQGDLATPPILQPILLRKMEERSTLLEKKVQRPHTKGKNKTIKTREEKPRSIKVVEGEQSEFQQIVISQSKSNQTKKGVAPYLEGGKRGQRKIYEAAKGTMEAVEFPLLENGIAYTDKDAERSRLPNCLQSRHRSKEIQNRHRNRRTGPLEQKSSKERQEKAKNVGISRVDRVEIHEQGGGPKADTMQEKNTFVYCLSIKKNSNFFADGILVHNCHYLKSRKAQRTKSFKNLSRKIPHLIALSGTPLTNKPAELWPILNMLKPKLFPSFFEFCLEYAQPKRTYWGWDFSGAKNLDQLHALLKKEVMIRRRKEDVLKELPAKTRILLPVDLPPAGKKEYDKAANDFMRWLVATKPGKKKLRMTGLSKMTALTMLAARLKLPLVETWIEDFLEETDEKLIVFGIHHCVLEPLHEKFKRVSVLVDGNVTGKKKQQYTERFQTRKDCRIFFGNIQAAGSGWNGQVASNVLFAEIGWTPGEMNQCEDRIHRIGQTKGAMCYYMVAKGTIEHKLCQIVQAKSEILDQTLDGKVRDDSIDIYSQLIQNFKKKGQR